MMNFFTKTVAEFLESTESQESIDRTIVELFRVAHPTRSGHEATKAELVSNEYFGTKSEVNSWEKSAINAFGGMLRTAGKFGSHGISLEFPIPGCNLRIDAMVSGSNETGEPVIAVLEFKQWPTASAAECCGSYLISHGKLGQDGLHVRKKHEDHPGQQAFEYVELLKMLKEPEGFGAVKFVPIVFMHDMTRDTAKSSILSEQYSHLEKEEKGVRYFFKDESNELSEYLLKIIPNGDQAEIIKSLEKSKSNAKPDQGVLLLAQMNNNSDQFSPLTTEAAEEQNSIVNEIVRVASIQRASQKDRTIIILRGGPGTGKSVIGLRVLGELLRRSQSPENFQCRFTSQNASLRARLEKQINVEEYPQFKGFFQAPNDFTKQTAQVSPELFDASPPALGKKGTQARIKEISDLPLGVENVDITVADEAHRLAVTGTYESFKHNDETDSFVTDIIRRSRTSVFLFDENQFVSLKDVGTIGAMREQADKLKNEFATVECLTFNEDGKKLVPVDFDQYLKDEEYKAIYALKHQLRVKAGNGFLDIVRAMLGEISLEELRSRVQSGSVKLNEEFDLRVFQDPGKMRDHLNSMRRNTNTNSLMECVGITATHCWPWISSRKLKSDDGNKQPRRPHRDFFDIRLPESKLPNGPFRFEMQWNQEESIDWADPLHGGTEDQVASVHKVQGIDLDLAGVILGPDFSISEEGEIVFEPDRRNRPDVMHLCPDCGNRPVKVSNDFISADYSEKLSKVEKLARSREIVRNQYFVLFTRGSFGLSLYSDNPEVRSRMQEIIDIVAAKSM